MTKRHLLVINPNTTATVSELLQQHAQAAVGDAWEVRTVTAAFGAPYISDEASYVLGSHAALDARTRAVAQGPAPDAVLIGCFGDPGLFALREASTVPVTGLAEGAFAQAASIGRFAVVTGGAAWGPMLRRLALTLGYADRLVDVITVAPTGVQLAAAPEEARSLLTQACQQAAALPRVDCVILGGAGLAGMAREVQAQVGVPVLDSVVAGATHAIGLT